MSRLIPICRTTDITLGHGCFPPEVVIAPYVSTNVFVERQGILRKGDMLAPHCCGLHCHQGVADGGSQTVFVNNKQVMGLGEIVRCGIVKSRMATSAKRTFVGGVP